VSLCHHFLSACHLHLHFNLLPRNYFNQLEPFWSHKKKHGRQRQLFLLVGQYTQKSLNTWPVAANCAWIMFGRSSTQIPKSFWLDKKKLPPHAVLVSHPFSEPNLQGSASFVWPSGVVIRGLIFEALLGLRYVLGPS